MSAADDEPLIVEFRDPCSNHSVDEDENEREAGVRSGFVVYRRRWYILALFSLLQFAFGVSSTTWGPMAGSAHLAFGWGRGSITLLINWSYIMATLVSFPLFWLMNEKGLRVSVLFSCTFLVFGTGLQCITTQTPYVTVLAHIGQSFIGIAGPVLVAAPPLMAVNWFPPSQSITASSVSFLFYSFGGLVTSILTPLFMHQLPSGNTTHLNMTSSSTPSPQEMANTVEDVKGKFQALLFVEFGVTALLTVLVFLYFPSKPPTPPGSTAETDRLGFKEGMLNLLRNRNFIMLALVYALLIGLVNGWLSVIIILFQRLKYSQAQVDNVAVLGGALSILGLFIVGILSEKIYRFMKPAILILFGICSLFSFWILLSLMKVLSPNIILNFALPFCIFSMCLNATIPLFYELGCEMAYPVGEGMTNGLLTWSSNPISCIYLLLLMIPGIGTMWMTWALFITLVLAVLGLIFVKISYKRSDKCE